jgi:hypothetical protein
VTLSRTNTSPMMTMTMPVFVQKGQPIDAISFHRPSRCLKEFILLVQF